MWRSSLVLAIVATFFHPGMANAQLAFTTVVGSFSPEQPGGNPVLIGTISGQAGFQIAISQIGIGGDSDANSGDNMFRAVGGSLDFTWVAGQEATPADFRLSPTPVVSGPTLSARGFSFAGVNFLADEGQSVSIFWARHVDYDGRYTFASDPLGTFYDDQLLPSSIRPWIGYSLQPVPEPSAYALLGLAALGGLWFRRRRKPT